MIKQTKDYSIFKIHKSNREIDKHNLKKIQESIQARNLLKWRPILVNNEMEIIDGQHRLEACKALNLPIYYEIQENSKDEDIYLLNSNQKNWTQLDYLKYYVTKGKLDYIKMNDFMVNNKTSLKDCVKLFGFFGNEFSNKFKRGIYVHPSIEVEVRAVDTLKKINIILDFIKIKKSPGYAFVNSYYFKEALIQIIHKEEFDFDYFMKKLELCMEKLKKCMSPIYYQQILLDIYNWKKTSNLLT